MSQAWLWWQQRAPIRWQLWGVYCALLATVLTALGLGLYRTVDRLLISAAVEAAVAQVASVARREAASWERIDVAGAPDMGAGLGHRARAFAAPDELPDGSAERHESPEPPLHEPPVGPPFAAPGMPPPRPPGQPSRPPPLPEPDGAAPALAEPPAGNREAIVRSPFATSLLSPGPGAGLGRVARSLIIALNGRDLHISAYTPVGDLLMAGAVADEGPGPPVATRAEIEVALSGRRVVRVVADRRPRVALLVLPVTSSEWGRGVVVVAVSLASADAAADAVRKAILLGATVMGLLGLGIGVPLTGLLLRPLDRLVAVADRVSAGELGTRSRIAGTNEVGRLAVAFDRMLDRLGALLEAQRRFVADASHELKSPLTGLGGMLEVLPALDDGDDATRWRVLGAMDRELGRMNRLVADLLLLSRLDTGPALARTPVDLVDVVADALESVRMLDDGAVRVEVLARPSVTGDPHALTRLVRNLVDNARKATAGGGEVVVRLDQRDGTAVVEVSDTGVGIGPEALPHLFERFFRADAARARQSGGTGLGLAIARAIARAHGGELAVHSDGLGRGATFTLRLPAGGRPSSDGPSAGGQPREWLRRPLRRTPEPSGNPVLEQL